MIILKFKQAKIQKLHLELEVEGDFNHHKLKESMIYYSLDIFLNKIQQLILIKQCQNWVIEKLATQIIKS